MRHIWFGVVLRTGYQQQSSEVSIEAEDTERPTYHKSAELSTVASFLVQMEELFACSLQARRILLHLSTRSDSLITFPSLAPGVEPSAFRWSQDMDHWLVAIAAWKALPASPHHCELLRACAFCKHRSLRYTRHPADDAGTP